MSKGSSWGGRPLRHRRAATSTEQSWQGRRGHRGLKGKTKGSHWWPVERMRCLRRQGPGGVGAQLQGTWRSTCSTPGGSSQNSRSFPLDSKQTKHSKPALRNASRAGAGAGLLGSGGWRKGLAVRGPQGGKSKGSVLPELLMNWEREREPLLTVTQMVSHLIFVVTRNPRCSSY